MLATAAGPASALSETLAELEPLAVFAASYLDLEVEILAVREALGELDAAARARELAAEIVAIRNEPIGERALAQLRGRRRQAAEALVRAAETQLATARWPGDRAAADYAAWARRELDAARLRLAASGGDEPDGGVSLRPVAAVLGAARGRTDGARPFDGIDAEVESALRSLFAGMPHPDPAAASPQPPAPSPAPNPSPGTSGGALAMSKGQQFLSVSHAECLARAKAALQTLGYTSWGDAGNGSWGERQNQGAVIFCEVTVGGREVVDIVVATEGSSDPGVPGAERERLQRLMEQAAAPSGCESSAYSVAVEPSVARTGQEISIRYTSQGEMHERDWIGIYPLGRTPSDKIDWVYTRVRRETGCQWKLIAPPPGEYEVAYLLDDSYDQVRARARFTVLP